MTVKADVLFAVVPEWIVYAEIGPQAVRLYAALARHADKETGHARPSRRRLAELLRCSPDTIDRALKELVDVGAVTVQAREIEGTKERTTNDYVVHVLPTRSRVDAATGGGISAATGGRTDAAVNESHLERESLGTISDVPARRMRPRDLVIDALAEIDGATNLSQVTRSRWATIGTKAAELRAAAPDVTVVEIRRRAANWSTHFDSTLTAPALVTHWARLAVPGTNGPSRRAPRDRAREIADQAAEMAEARRASG